MATSVNARPACFLDGIAVAAQDLRDGANALLTYTGQSNTGGLACTAGVRGTAGAPLASLWTSGMSFTLNAGVCFVQGTASATAGLWPLVLDTNTTLTCTTSDPTNPRIDSVIAVVVDNGNNTSTAQFKILPGTPAVSPVAPTLPANSLLLCNISVGANVSTLASNKFTDKRVYTTALGGILPFQNAAIGTTVGGIDSSYVHDLNTGRLRALDGSGIARQPKTAAFVPAYAQSISAVTLTSVAGVVQTVSVTVDGATELEYFASWSGIGAAASAAAGDAAQLWIALNGTALANNNGLWSYRQDSTSAAYGGGGSFHAWSTPAAGTYTVTLNGRITIGSNTYNVNTPTLRVGPSWS